MQATDVLIRRYDDFNGSRELQAARRCARFRYIKNTHLHSETKERILEKLVLVPEPFCSRSRGVGRRDACFSWIAPSCAGKLASSTS